MNQHYFLLQQQQQQQQQQQDQQQQQLYPQDQQQYQQQQHQPQHPQHQQYPIQPQPQQQHQQQKLYHHYQTPPPPPPFGVGGSLVLPNTFAAAAQQQQQQSAPPANALQYGQQQHGQQPQSLPINQLLLLNQLQQQQQQQTQQQQQQFSQIVQQQIQLPVPNPWHPAPPQQYQQSIPPQPQQQSIPPLAAQQQQQQPQLRQEPPLPQLQQQQQPSPHIQRQTAAAPLQPQQKQILPSYCSQAPYGLDCCCCKRCHVGGCDLKLLDCGCCFHARCCRIKIEKPGENGAAALDDPNNTTTESSGTVENNNDDDDGIIKACPLCQAPMRVLELSAMSFAEIDQAQDKAAQIALVSKRGKKRQNATVTRLQPHLASSNNNNNTATTEEENFNDDSNENNAITENPTGAAVEWKQQQHHSTAPTSSNELRTGRWTKEETAFCDKLIEYFEQGKLPLPDGIKLNDFLSNMLKSKQSRLTKKMKNAKLSMRQYRKVSGYIASDAEARHFSNLESDFFASIKCDMERSEIRFHMQKEWRELFSRYCTSIGFPPQKLEATEWLNSVEELERRASLVKDAARMARRKIMMGYALSQDSMQEGIFIENHVSTTSTAADATITPPNHPNGGGGAPSSSSSTMPTYQPMPPVIDPPPSAAQRSTSVASLASNSDVHSTSSVGSSSNNGVGVNGMSNSKRFKSSFSSTLPPAASSSAAGSLSLLSQQLETRQQLAAKNAACSSPFVARAMMYVQKHNLPFEYVDAWVPSLMMQQDENAASQTATGGAMHQQQQIASSPRLCFAGCAMATTQIPAEGTGAPQPISSDEAFDLNSFALYSQKFSFDVGKGLPGRVYQTGQPSWEQGVHLALSSQFERSGGASQWGIQTVVGIPVKSYNVGRVVAVFYSRKNRPKDTTMVERMMEELNKLMPLPQWKLVVDVGAPGMPPIDSALTMSDRAFLSVIEKYMPRNKTSELSEYLPGFTSIRILLTDRMGSPRENELLQTAIDSYQSYRQSGKSDRDAAWMTARDFMILSKRHIVGAMSSPSSTTHATVSLNHKQQQVLPTGNIQIIQGGSGINQKVSSCCPGGGDCSIPKATTNNCTTNTTTTTINGSKCCPGGDQNCYQSTYATKPMTNSMNGSKCCPDGDQNCNNQSTITFHLPAVSNNDNNLDSCNNDVVHDEYDFFSSLSHDFPAEAHEQRQPAESTTAMRGGTSPMLYSAKIAAGDGGANITSEKNNNLSSHLMNGYNSIDGVAEADMMMFSNPNLTQAQLSMLLQAEHFQGN